MKTWKLLEAVLNEGTLREDKQFRGASGMRLKDLDKLLRGDDHRPGITGRSPNPDGEMVNGKGYAFSGDIWGPWFSNMAPALSIATSDKAGDNHHGAPQGVHALKKAYGGSVSFAPGKARTDFERRPSAMDFYDVLMIAEITTTQVLDKKTKKVVQKKNGQLITMVYSPSIGSMEERKARLQAMLSGQAAAPLSRRPQSDVPGELPKPQQLSPELQAMRAKRDAEEKATNPVADQGSRDGSAVTGNDGWKAKLAAHDKTYTPQNKNRIDTPDVDRMFDPDDLPADRRPPKRHR